MAIIHSVSITETTTRTLDVVDTAEIDGWEHMSASDRADALKEYVAEHGEEEETVVDLVHVGAYQRLTR